MTDGTWPERSVPAAAVDLDKLRIADSSRDVAGVLAAIEGRDISDALQQVGSAVLHALLALRQAQRTEKAQGAGAGRAVDSAISVVQRLEMRGLPGDEELAADLLAAARDKPLPGKRLPVDLEELSGLLEGDPANNEGGFVDLQTGEVLPRFMIDSAMVGDNESVDIEDEPDRWLYIFCEGSKQGWRDMAEFAARTPDSALAQRMDRALAGNGAYRRFRDIVEHEGLGQAWHAFSDDRRIGRARHYLADEGIRS